MTESFKTDNTEEISGMLNRRFLHFVIICLLGLLVYSNTFNVPFQWDEDHFIKDNPVVSDFTYFVEPSLAPVQFYGSLVGRYVGYLTFALNYKIGGLNVTGYHVFNLAVHIFNALLVYLFVVLTFRSPYFRRHVQWAADYGRIMTEGGRDPDSRFTSHGSQSLAVHSSRYTNFVALSAALLFVSHPVQTEAVTYIFQRFASLAAMFYLLSIVMYAKSRLLAEKARGYPPTSAPFKLSGDTGGGHRHGSRFAASIVYYLLSLLFAVLAMKTKENAFTLPIIIILYEFLFFEGSKSERAVFLIPISMTLLIIPVTLFLTSGIVTNPFDPSTVVFRQIPRWDYFITQARVLVTYIRLILLPFNQDIDYDYPVFHSLLEPSVFLSGLFLLSLLGIAVYLLFKTGDATADKRAGVERSPSTIAFRLSPYFRLVSFGVLWFFITQVVESSLQPIPQVMDEYRVYLPMAGVAVAAAAGLLLLYKKFRGRKIGAPIILTPLLFAVIFSAAAYQRNSVWETRVSLWRDAASKSPRKASVHINLGAAYALQGELDKAITQYQSALRLDPFYKEAYYDLCVACSRKNLPDEAIYYCRTAVSLYPDSIQAHYDLGRMYLERGLSDDARRELEIALQKNPDFYPARKILYDMAGKSVK